MSWSIHLYWLLGWIAVGFGVVEGLAIAHHKTVDTFSYSVWVWLGTFSHPPNRAWRVTTFSVFWWALYLHFVIGVGWPWIVVPAIPLTGLVFTSTFVWKER